MEMFLLAVAGWLLLLISPRGQQAFGALAPRLQPARPPADDQPPAKPKEQPADQPTEQPARRGLDAKTG